MTPARRAAAWGGLIGPAAFIATWSVLGATADGYSPVGEAISRLAAAGEPTRAWMTLGLVTFGVGVGAHALVMRGLLAGPTWLLLLLGAMATAGVGAFPLNRADTAHFVAAAISYSALALAPLAASRRLAAAARPLAAGLSVAAGVTTAALLAASVVPPWGAVTGLLQRGGLAVADAWIMVSAAGALAGPLDGPRSAPRPSP